MSDPSVAQIRHAVASIGAGQVPDPALEDLQIGASEAVSHARRHGRPPITARIWAAPGRILVRVHHAGPAPGDPLAGLVPAWSSPELDGAELWLIHMLDLDTAMIRSPDGFTIRLAAWHAA
jgi:anti-sigma regulatory factor (Ser/Thr protein kinase)